MQPGDAFERVGAEEQGRTDVVQGVALDVSVADGPRQLDRPPAPVEGLGNATREHGQLRLVAQRHGQLVSCSERFEGRDGEVGVPLGLGTATEEPEEPRHPALRGADRLRRRVRLRVELERPTACRESRVGLVGEVALVREAVVEGRGTAARSRTSGKRSASRYSRAASRCAPRRAGVAGGSDGVADGVLLLPGPGGVVGQPVVVGATQPDQGSQGGGVPAGARAGARGSPRPSRGRSRAGTRTP